MKKLLSLIVLFTFFASSAFAQFPGMGGSKAPKIKGKISGELVDSLSNEKVGYATIVVKRSGKEKELNGILSDDDGKFKIEDVTSGTYDLYISFLGYAEKIIRGVELTKKKPDMNLGKILLVQDNFMLNEVEVTADRALIENKVDKIVYNAENDASIAGGDAADVLRKVPMLSVDLDGNVSMRGSQNVRILINGKPSGMFSNNVADALKMFPADQIQKVEVITSPGAKYDGEGTAGIVNIITKKGNVEGVAGSFDVSVGTRQNSLVGNLNAGKGRFGSSASGSVFYSLPAVGVSEFSRVNDTGNGLVTFLQEGSTETSRLGFSGSASAFYDFNAFNSLNTSISYQGFGFDVSGESVASTTRMSGAPDVLWNRTNFGENLFSGYDWNTDFTKKFEDHENREFSIAYQLSGNIQNQDYTVTQTGNPNFLRNDNLFNDGDNLESTVQVDYVHPFENKMKLEVGAKTVLRNIVSDSKFSAFNPATNSYDLIDASKSQVFEYGQDVYAGYAQLNYSIKKFQFITGVRYETTAIDGRIDDGSEPFEQSYSNWLPNFTISRGLKNFQNIKFSYTQRIQRPSLYFINPFNNNVDQVNVTVGNPQLEPEIADQFELSYNTFIKGVGIFSSAYYKITDGIIESILGLNNQNITINTFDNVGTNRSLGLNLFSTKNINNFTIRGGGNIFTYNAEGIINGVELERKTYEYNVFFGGEYSITPTIKADFFGFFNSPRRSLQGDQASFSIYGFGARKEFKKWSVGIKIIEPFQRDKFFNSSQSGPDFTQDIVFSIPFRSFGINARYKFGKVDFKERQSKIKNDDLKSGQEGGGNGGGNFGGNNN